MECYCFRAMVSQGKTGEKITMTIHIFIAHMGIGGAERVCVNLANEFIEQGNDVHLVVLNLNQDVNTHLLSKKVQVHSLSVSRLRYSPLAMLRYLNTWKPKFLFVFGNEMAVILNKMKKIHLTNVPIVVRVLNNVDISLSKDDHISPIVEKYLKNQQKQLRSVEHVIAQCQGMQEMLLRNNLVKSENLTAIYNPVSYPLIQNTLKLRTPFEKRDKNRVKEIVFIGRIDPQKNLSHLLEAFAIVHQTMPATRLRLIGDGNVVEAMQTLAKDLNIEKDVSFEGITKHMEQIYATADVVALSSDYEGMPNCLIEAIASGIPVVSYDCPLGPKEIIVDNENGFLVEYQNKEQLALRLVDALSREWDENAIRKSADKFDVKQIAKQYAEIFGQFI